MKTPKLLTATDVANIIENTETAKGNTFLNKVELSGAFQKFIITTKLDENYSNFKRLTRYFKNSSISLVYLSLKHYRNTNTTQYKFVFLN